MRILCVDDDRVSLTIMQRLVVSLGMGDTVECASDGNEAVGALDRRPVDLLITDLQIPGPSGLELIDEARGRRPGTEVIVITGHQSVESAVEAMKRGARDYIAKPIDRQLLAQKVENIRDILDERAAAEECRYAREMMEEALARNVRELERALASRDALLAGVADLLASGLGPEELVGRLREAVRAPARSGR